MSAAPNNNNEPEPTEAESKMTEAIARDRPTIDAAVKSFISMVCARTMAASSTDVAHDKVMMGIIPSLAKSSISETKKSSNDDTQTSDEVSKPSLPSVQQQVLQLARYILRAVNAYTFPIQDTVAYSKSEKPGTTEEKKLELLELSVVARLWNGLSQSDQKPSRFLGRKALKLAWKNLDVQAQFPSQTDENDVVRERQLEWLQLFEKLLMETNKPLPSDMNVDDDSALLWAADGGAAELAKRRQRRLDAAKERGPVTPS